MYVDHVRHSVNERVYEQVLLRESYRERGGARSQVKHRTLLNLTRCDRSEVAAIEWALKHKHALPGVLTGAALDGLKLVQGPSVGAVWLLYQVAERIGLVKALGSSPEGLRTLWQVFARCIDQGSRLSGVRLAGEHAACAVLGLGPFDEESLYRDLDGLDARQASVEVALYRRRRGAKASQLFLYDVTSTYLEGRCNAYGAYGYNRDRKRGKLQIVVGLLTDGEGFPVSVEVFQGNTQDPQTVSSQIRKLVERFDAHEVTLVGDRGMLKSLQLEELAGEGFHYLTAITKPQIDTLLARGVLQMELFEDRLGEIHADGLRYLVRRNPQRAAEVEAQREDKYRCVLARAQARNAYLAQHLKARVETARKEVAAYARTLRIDAWARVEVERRTLRVDRDETALAELARLDGCYVIKTDVAVTDASAELLHARYKDLGLVEQAFRTCKTAHLELRPVYVRTPAHTRAHAFVVMLAYLLRCALARAWAGLDLTVEEGLRQLTTLCATEVRFPDGKVCLTVPVPRDSVAALFAAAEVIPPTALPRNHAPVATKQKLAPHRKTR
ncbi:MAG: IS1634 family transposase [Planctomycetota bacterium]|jgi:hypothetical protein|nr:IS1634 family transposase [Planctomycetota bacterium]